MHRDPYTEQAAAIEDRAQAIEDARAAYIAARVRDLLIVLADPLACMATRVERGPWAPASRERALVAIGQDFAWWVTEQDDPHRIIRAMVHGWRDAALRPYALDRAAVEAEGKSDDYWMDF